MSRNVQQTQDAFKEKYPLVFRAIYETSNRAIGNKNLKWSSAMWKEFNEMVKNIKVLNE